MSRRLDVEEDLALALAGLVVTVFVFPFGVT
jgi:hypothetical protein